MLNPSELLLIVATALVATAVVTGATLLVLRVTRRRGIATRLAIVLAGALVSIVVATVGVAGEMYLSDHDLVVLAWVIGVSAVVSMLAAWMITGRSARSSALALVRATRRVGDGDVVAAAPTGWRELDDISTELADTSERLAEARAEISSLDSARRQFFAWISHDLRTPLAGMRAMAEALEEGTAPEPEVYIRLIKAKVDTVDRMVDDLFQLSRLQSGTFELHPEPVVLLDLVSDAVADVQLLAAERGIVIEQDGVDGHMIWADPREITRAIGNLLSNSVRYAPDDSVVIVRADTVDSDRLVLSVIDRGAGVTAEDLGRMFDVGWRADASRSAAPEAGGSAGAGLGLAIVRGIVEAHGGDVRARRTDDGFQLDLVLPTGRTPGSA